MKFRKNTAIISVACLLVCATGSVRGQTGPVREFEGGSMYRTAGDKFYVLRLEGSFAEMGRQYGGLASNEMAAVFSAVTNYMIGVAGATYADLLAYANAGHARAPYFAKDLVSGMSETSGMGTNDQVILSQSLLILASAACSGMIAWGEYASGNLVIGRNWDICTGYFTNLSEHLCVTVFNPGGYAEPVADVGYMGMFFPQTVMNRQGLFLDLQNGQMSDTNINMSAVNGGYQIMAALMECAKLGHLDRDMFVRRPEAGLIINAADANRGYSYEWATFATMRADGTGTGVVASANHFTLPEWSGYGISIITNDTASTGYSVTRRTNLLARAELLKGGITSATMRDIFDTTIPNGGPSFPHDGSLGAYTVHQVVAEPASLTFWIKAPPYSGWEQVSLAPLFQTNSIARVHLPPTPIPGTAGNMDLAYELHFSQFATQRVEITRLDVFDAGSNSLLRTYSGADLAGCMVTNLESKWPGGRREAAMIWLAIPPNQAVPETLRHGLYFTPAGGGATNYAEIAFTPCLANTPAVIRPPLRGDNWIAFNVVPHGHHWRAFIDTNSARVSQRYAVDWMQGRYENDEWIVNTGDPAVLTNYFCYGADLLAAAAGTVVQTRDGIEENVPGSIPTNITMETLAGNHVVLDIGDGNCAFYGHMIPGTVCVTNGQAVSAGQVLGRLGNSGNSTAPHLHFHIADSADLFASEGLPYVINVQGCRGTAINGTPPSPPSVMFAKTPDNEAVCRFAGGQPGDFSGNGRSDLAVYMEATGQWFIIGADGTLVAWAHAWGGAGLTPAPGDYDGDGVSDYAVYDANNGLWYIQSAAGSLLAWAKAWGVAGVIPAPGDYDGDGKSDLAVYWPDYGYWYILTMSDQLLAFGEAWGGPGLQPVAGDYDGDGVMDLAVYDANTGFWYIRRLEGGLIAWMMAWGNSYMTPVAGDYDGDGMADPAVYHLTTGQWYVRTLAGSVLVSGTVLVSAAGVPVPGDYDGDGAADMAEYQAASGQWAIYSPRSSVVIVNTSWGGPNMTPVY